MITPFPVPIHSRLQTAINEVTRTKENPNFPVPMSQTAPFIQNVNCKQQNCDKQKLKVRINVSISNTKAK